MDKYQPIVDEPFSSQLTRVNKFDNLTEMNDVVAYPKGHMKERPHLTVLLESGNRPLDITVEEYDQKYDTKLHHGVFSTRVVRGAPWPGNNVYSHIVEMPCGPTEIPNSMSLFATNDGLREAKKYRPIWCLCKCNCLWTAWMQRDCFSQGKGDGKHIAIPWHSGECVMMRHLTSYTSMDLALEKITWMELLDRISDVFAMTTTELSKLCCLGHSFMMIAPGGLQVTKRLKKQLILTMFGMLFIKEGEIAVDVEQSNIIKLMLQLIASLSLQEGSGEVILPVVLNLIRKIVATINIINEPTTPMLQVYGHDCQTIAQQLAEAAGLLLITCDKITCTMNSSIVVQLQCLAMGINYDTVVKSAEDHSDWNNMLEHSPIERDFAWLIKCGYLSKMDIHRVIAAGECVILSQIGDIRTYPCIILEAKPQISGLCSICQVNYARGRHAMPKVYPKRLVWTINQCTMVVTDIDLLCEMCGPRGFIAVSHQWNVGLEFTRRLNNNKWIDGMIVLLPKIRGKVNEWYWVDQLTLKEIQEEKLFMNLYYEQADQVVLISGKGTSVEQELQAEYRLWCVCETLVATQLIIIDRESLSESRTVPPWRSHDAKWLATRVGCLQCGDINDIELLFKKFPILRTEAIGTAIILPGMRMRANGWCWAPIDCWQEADMEPILSRSKGRGVEFSFSHVTNINWKTKMIRLNRHTSTIGLIVTLSYDDVWHYMMEVNIDNQYMDWKPQALIIGGSREQVFKRYGMEIRTDAYLGHHPVKLTAHNNFKMSIFSVKNKIS